MYLMVITMKHLQLWPLSISVNMFRQEFSLMFSSRVDKLHKPIQSNIKLLTQLVCSQNTE